MMSTHPTDELLLSYLNADLGDDEDAGIERHLRECDLCVSGLVTMQPHSVFADAMALRVPAAVVARVVFQSPRRTEPQEGTRTVARRPFLLRWPVLIPTSLAAGFLLGISASLLRSPEPLRMTRSIDSRESMSVAVVDTALLREPKAGAEVVAGLQRGEQIKIIERRAEWVRIERSGGEQGWVNSEHLR